MEQSISPQEFQLLQDNPVIRTKCPHGVVTDEMIVKRVRNGNLAVGDRILVQCMDHEYARLLAETEYRVIERTSKLRVHEVNDRETRQVDEITYRVARVRDWWFPAVLVEGSKASAPSPMPLPNRYVDADSYRKWNRRTQLHDVLRRADDSLICTHTDKETADRIAAGELAVPSSAEAA